MSSVLLWIINSIFVVLIIPVFAAPFWLSYRRASKPPQGELGEKIEDFFSSRQMDWLVFSWAAAEAVAWFIIPEFFLLLIIFMRLKQRINLLRWDFGGTIVGTVIAYYISSYLPIGTLPYITSAMVAQVDLWYSELGVWAVAYQPFIGIPYKVFTHLAAEHHISLFFLVVIGTIVRMARYVIIYCILSALYPFLHRYAHRNYLGVYIASCCVFTFLLLKTVNLYGLAYRVH